jgi:DNA modification methylase
MHLIHDTDHSKLYCGNNLELLKSLPTGSINLTVTSPPYDSLRDYTKEDSWTFEKFTELATELHRVTADGGVVVWNVSDQTKDGSESGSSFRQALYFMQCGFLLADTMIYKKANPGGARGSNKTYIQCFEYMFVFSKGPLKTHNLINDRPNKEKSGIRHGAGKRKKNGEIGETVAYEAKPFGRRFNIWEYPTQTNEYSGQHPAPFPYGLAEDHVLSWSNSGDVVLDPFNGSGTTMAAAVRNNRRSIGIDISDQYCEIAHARLLDAEHVQDMNELFT